MLSLKDIHEQIANQDLRLEELVTEITTAADDAAICEATFRAEFAKERLRARAEAITKGVKITVDEVEDRATLMTQAPRQAHLIASNNLTALREALRATQARMDGLRTMAASFRGAGG